MIEDGNEFKDFAENFSRALLVEENNLQKVAKNPSLLERIMSNIGKTVREDEKVVFAVFFTGLSAYAPEPLNLFIYGPSSTGKTYGTLQTCQVFPEKDVMSIGAASPRFLIRQHGVLVDASGTPLTVERPEKPKKSDYVSAEDYREALSLFKAETKLYADQLRDAYTLIELSGKTLIFLESPNLELFNILRPILSHDKAEISFPYVDKNSKGQICTVNVTVKGWPACIFLNARDQYVEELATRSFTVSPLESTSKYGVANKVTNEFANFPWEKEHIEQYRREIRTFIEYLKSQIKDKNYIVPFDLSSLYPHELPRDMRDFKHLLQLIQCVTALHAKQRLILVHDGKEYLVANVDDVELAFTKFKAIFETTRTGLSEHVLNFYYKVAQEMPIDEEYLEAEKKERRRPWKTGELVTKYNAAFLPKRSRRTILRYLELLEEVGYVSSGEDSDDKRSFTWTALLQQNNENCASGDIQRMSEDLKLTLEKSLKTWFDRLGHDTSFYLEKKNNEPQWLPWTEVEKTILSQKAPMCHDPVEAENSSKKQFSLKESDIEEKTQNAQSKSEENLNLIPCPLCTARGQKMFFTSDRDLKLHVDAFHNGSPNYVS